MGDDWDAEDFDVDKGFVDESKEEEEDLALAEVSVPEAQPKPKQTGEVLKPQKSKMERINEKKAQRRTKEVEASKAEEEEEAPKLSEAEERRRREELQKESDLRLAMETFGGGAEGGTSTLDAMNPKTEEEFISFKDALSGKITQYEGSVHYRQFMEQLMIKCCAVFDAGDLRHLSNVLSTMATEKQKAKSTKGATKKKVKASLGARAVGKGAKRLDDMDYDNELGAEFDDFI